MPNTFNKKYRYAFLIFQKAKPTELKTSKTVLILLFFIIGYLSSSAQTNIWMKKADFGGGARTQAVGFSVGGKGYIGTGYDINSSLMKDFWEYDPNTDSWTQKADFGGGVRIGVVGFNIGSKGYIGTGHDGSGSKKDFWEYDPITNVWTREADFGGTERSQAVGFPIGSKGYIGTGLYYDGEWNFLNDFWEYDPDSNKWARKADFAGESRGGATGFGIGNKGYIGTGYDIGDNNMKDFWEYDPPTDIWTQKADFGGSARIEVVGFGIGNKGYIGTGYEKSSDSNLKDFWEYDPVINVWTRKADLEGTARGAAIGFSIGSKGYIGTGEGNGFSGYTYFKDFYQYTSDSGCPIPINLRALKIRDTCARLNWNIPDSFVEHIKISYRKLGDTIWIEDRKKSLENSKWICGLSANTSYEWKVRNICADEKTDWVHGPDFTTTSLSAFASSVSNNNLVEDTRDLLLITPNPSRGNFVVQMHLDDKAAYTTLSLYNNIGKAIWQQGLGMQSGTVSKNIAMENKLSAGMYLLIVQHGEKRLMRKVVVNR